MDPKIFSGLGQSQPGPKGKEPVEPGNVAIKIPSGKDLVQSLFRFCCRNRVALTVLSSSGQLSDVILRGQQSPIVGPFDIESLSGYVSFNSLESSFPFQVTLGAPDGQLYPRIMVGGRTSTIVEVAAMMNVQLDEDNDVIVMESKNDELDDDFWNSLSPIVDLSPFEGV